ncbi:cysteine--tRNA ligase, partial [Candidatus Micrarchaeota archaeon]|nr:cysteine--tRNA ligase [Candidatus Micrarchaeota archaeon]
MRVFNSLTKQSEEFHPVHAPDIILYVCGLTPYDSAHIGHARTCISFDVIKRYLTKKGYSVFHIQNITDVDDKIIKRCKETGTDPKQLTETIHTEALELFDQLSIRRANVYPKVTEHMKEIIELIEQLIARGAAYETDSGVYFDISSFSNYGKLSGQNLDEIRDGARIEVDETKTDPGDFALWKKTTGELLEFTRPWGSGRPGWHIECSAMAQKYAKRTLDIHGGARDLIFPHHENEIAQSEAASGTLFAKHWLHAGFLTVNGEKMSKSIGNFITIKTALNQFSANAMRLFYLQAHYRSPVDYNEETLGALEESVERIFNSVGLLKECLSTSGSSTIDRDFRKKSDSLISLFYSNMDEDFNTPEALAALFNLLRLANSHVSMNTIDRDQIGKIILSIEEMLWIFGIMEKKSLSVETKLDSLNSLLKELGSEPQKNAENALNQIVDLRES